MTAAAFGLITGTLALFAASSQQDANIGWSIVIFGLGVIVGCVCVLIADVLHTRKVQQGRTERRSGGRVDA